MNRYREMIHDARATRVPALWQSTHSEICQSICEIDENVGLVRDVIRVTKLHTQEINAYIVYTEVECSNNYEAERVWMIRIELQAFAESISSAVFF